MTEFMGLAEKVSKFNQEALKHMERQTLNPFSGRFSRSPSPRPKFNKDEYGKPAAGSKTELRGQRAFTQINREVLELCEVIHDMGARRRDSDGDECIIIPFGELFAFYTKISDKVVGLLIAAKKRGYVWFEPEILFQRRDDDVLIALLKPIEEIRDVIRSSASPSPAPTAAASSDAEKPSPSSTPSPLARQDSNTSIAASSADTESLKSNPDTISITSVDETTPSSVENAKEVSSTSPVAEAVQTPLFPVVEEEPVSSAEAAVVESKQEPTEVIPENTHETNSEVKPESAHEGKTESEQTTAVTEPSSDGTENISTEETTPSSKKEDITSSSAVTEAEVSLTPSESVASPEEQIATTEATSGPEDQDSLTLKIIVEVEPDQTLPTSTVEVTTEDSPAESEHILSNEPSATVEEPSATLQESHNDVETSFAPATTIEPEHVLSSSDKNDRVPITEKEQTPSNDTGETMA